MSTKANVKKTCTLKRKREREREREGEVYFVFGGRDGQLGFGRTRAQAMEKERDSFARETWKCERTSSQIRV